MAFPLVSVLGKLVKIAGNVLGVDSVKDVVDAFENNKLTPEQKVALELATQEHVKDMRAMDVEEMKTFVSESVAMINSQDKYTSRARPTGLYLAYAFTGVAILALVFGMMEKDVVQSVLILIAPFWGAGAHYQYLRTKEKLNGVED